jgi:hypothetical protein
MSNSFRVTLDGNQLDLPGELRLSALYRVAVGKSISPSTASTVRLEFLKEDFGTSIQPFLASAAFDALIGKRRKRSETVPASPTPEIQSSSLG